MFAVRFSRCIIRTHECFYQTAKYSQLLRVGRVEQKISSSLRKTLLVNKHSFCTITNESLSEKNELISEEYKPNFEAVAEGDPELEKKLKVLLLEIEVLRQENAQVPTPGFMKDEYWRELLQLNSRTARKKYLVFLFKKEKIKENQKRKKEEKRLIMQENRPKREEEQEGVLTYKLMGNNIFLRFYDTTINNFYNSRVMQAMMFGQKLILDCGFEKQMTRSENVNCAKQLMLLFGDNRIHDDPYDLHFCNFDKNGTLYEFLKRQMPTLEDPAFPLNIHKESYLDLFPKKQLVYLTPHCKETIEEYNHDDIYIVGAMVDKSNQEPLSLAKAKQENLRMAKFPLDEYLQWGAGSGKSLTLNQCLLILLDVKQTGDWKYALRHVPKRKLVDYTEYPANPELRYDRRLQKFKSMWKPTVGLSKFSYNRQRQSASALISEDEADERKPKVDIKSFMK